MGWKPRSTRFSSLELSRYLELVEELPFVRAAHFEDGRLRIRTPEGTEELDAVVAGGALGYAHIKPVLARYRARAPWILFAPYVPPGIGAELIRNGGNYFDQVGNQHLSISGRYMVHVEGKTPSRRPVAHKPLRGPGLQVLLALLAEPQLASQAVREIAERSGASKSTVSNVLRQLQSDGRLIVSDGDVHLAPELWDTFAIGYAESLRPHWHHGCFRAREQRLPELIARIDAQLGDSITWGWGGAVAADLLTHHYQAPLAVLHVAQVDHALAQRLGLLRSEDGPFSIIHTACPAAFTYPMPHVVAPPLVYAELLVEGDDRALDAASILREQYQPST